jgi:hypothetical protein
MSLGSPKQIFHSHLEDSEIPDVGWSSKYLTDEDKERSRDMSCLEVRIDGIGDDDWLEMQALYMLRRIAWSFSDGTPGAAYLVFFEHSQLPKSRIRSYKGVFPYKGKIKQGEYIEFEFELEAGLSFFGGMAPVTKDNRDECFALAGSLVWGFIVVAVEQKSETYSREFLESIIPCLDTRGSISIDSLKLIPRVCSRDLIIFSFGSDTRGDSVNIRCFFKGKAKNFVEQTMGNAIIETDRYMGIYQIKPAPYAP